MQNLCAILDRNAGNDRTHDSHTTLLLHHLLPCLPAAKKLLHLPGTTPGQAFIVTTSLQLPDSERAPLPWWTVAETPFSGTLKH